MAKYIDVESLVVGYSGHTPDDEFSKGVDFVLDLLDSKPPEDVRPIIRAKWILEENMYGFLTCECSNCREVTNETVMGKPRFNYCPMCGATMEYNNA